MEGLTKKFPANIIVTEAVYARLPEDMQKGLTCLGTETLKGKEKSVKVYGIVQA